MLSSVLRNRRPPGVRGPRGRYSHMGFGVDRGRQEIERYPRSAESHQDCSLAQPAEESIKGRGGDILCGEHSCGARRIHIFSHSFIHSFIHSIFSLY